MNDNGNFESILNTYNQMTNEPQTNARSGEQPRESEDQHPNVLYGHQNNRLVTDDDLDESKNDNGSRYRSNEVHSSDSITIHDQDETMIGLGNIQRNAGKVVMKKHLNKGVDNVDVKLATKHAQQTDLRRPSSMNFLDQTDEEINDSKVQFQNESKLAQSSLWMRKSSAQSQIEKEEVINKSYDFVGLAKSKDSATLLKSMSFTVDISKLYTVLASTYTNQANPYCPVQLKVNDKQLIAHYGGQHLVQLWNKDMEIVYQRTRKQPVSNWNLIGSYFIFQEDESMSPLDYFVRQDQYKVVKIVGKNSIKQVTIEIEEDNSDDPNAKPSPIEHICCILEKNNANKKSIFLVIADNRTVSYIDLTQQLNQSTWTRSVSRPMNVAEMQEKEANNPEGPTIRIKRSKMHKTVMQNGWKIHQIQEIQPKGDCALICEDISKSELVFFHMKDLTENEAIFQPLAPHITDYRDDSIEYDSIVDYQSLMCYHQRLKAYKQSGIALRKSGSIDFYYDFRLVETSPAIPNKRIYTAIDQDFNDIHFKCYEKSADGEKVVLYSCQTSWKQRVGILSSEVRSKETIEAIKTRLQNYIQSLDDENLKMSVSMGRYENAMNNANIKALLQIDAETFCVGLHMKVSGYLRLYSSFLNTGRKFFLAHNRFVSIFDLAKDKWTQHDIFSDTVRQIFRNRKIRKGTIGRMYDIGVLVGDSTFRFYEFQKHGKISLTNTNVIKMEGKIRAFLQDQQNDTGFYFTEISSGGTESLNESQSSHSSSSAVHSAKLHVLVDKQISDISPTVNEEFPVKHLISIAMLFNDSASNQNFSIILDSQSDDNSLIQEQLQLELREDTEGHIIVEKEVKTQIDHSPIFKKIEDAGSEQETETMLGEIKYQNCVVTITSKHIILLNDDMEIKEVYENRNVCNFIYADKIWVYSLNNRRISYNNKLKKQSGGVLDGGLYVYDFSRLIDGAVEVHKLSNALGGANSFIDYDVVTQTISFIKSYSQIVMMPLPHRNTMKFFGMGDKKDYLIWRQQDGTFTALNKKLQITMWSTATGKIIKTQSAEIENDKARAKVKVIKRSKVADLKDPLKFVRDQETNYQTEADDPNTDELRKEFELYQANSKDHTYMGNWNNFEKWSVSLIVSQKEKQPKQPLFQKLLTKDTKRYTAHLDDKYVAFDNKSIMMSYQAQPDCKMHKFKVLKMGDADFIGKRTRRKDQSSIQILFGDKMQEIQWTEVFSFYFLTHNNPQERPFIYFNTELDRMLVQTANDFSAIIYHHTGVNEANEVEWKILYQIYRYPIILKGLSTANFLFSPSFERFIDIDYNQAEFVIKQSKDSIVVGRIPEGMISISFKGRNKSEDAISALASRIRFHSENEVQIITKEGLDCILNYKTFQVESVVAVDNFDIDDFSHPHAILEQNPIEYKDTVQRLMNTCNQIKQQRAHFTSHLKSKEPKLTEDEFNKKVVKMTYENMFSVDFSNQDCFAVELSFTMLDWIILERVIIDKTFDFSNVDEKQLLQMCFNIFPRIRSVFHHLSENPHVCDLNVIQRLFDSANKGVEMFGGKTVTLPIFKDDENETPMDACLNEGKTFNSKLVGFLFANTKDYPLLHSSYLLQHAVCRAIKMDVPGIVDYLEARMITSPQLSTEKMMANELYEHKKLVVSGYEYAIEEFPIWVDKSRVARELFDPKGFPKKLRLCFFDIPNISDMSEESDEFYNVLAESNNLELFTAQITHILINKAWYELRYFFFFFLMLPYLLLLFSYSFWQNYVIVDVDQQSLFQTVESQLFWGKYVCYSILLMCFIIISQEVYQFTRDPYQYVTSFWNFLDVLPLGFAAFGPTIFLMGYRLETYNDVLRRDVDLTIDTQANEIVDEYPLLRKVRAVTQIVASMMLWLKFTYFFRTQKEFAYLIQMIIEVIKDMFTFIVVMGVSVIAFTEASYSLSTNEFTAEPVFLNFSKAFVFTFWNAMGAFTMVGFEDNELAWILFYLLTVFNLIVMLNLLIAIISDTYRKVASTQEEFALKERACVVSDLKDFSFFRKLFTLKDPRKRNYLFIAINEVAEKLDDVDVNIFDINDQVIEVKQAVKRVEDMAELSLKLAQSQTSKLEAALDRQEIEQNPQPNYIQSSSSLHAHNSKKVFNASTYKK